MTDRLPPPRLGDVLFMSCQGRVNVPPGWIVVRPRWWKRALVALRLRRATTVAWKIKTDA